MRTPHTVFQNRPPRVGRVLIVSLIAIGLVSIGLGPRGAAAGSTNSESASVQTTVPMLTGGSQVVNNGPGDQTDPHVDCDRVSYTNDDFFGLLSIHYFDFASNTDHVIPGNGTDTLSDVYGGLVWLTEATVFGPRIALFDTATQTRTGALGSENSNPSVSSNVIAYEDRSLSTNPNESNITVYDFTTRTFVHLSIDVLFDKNPSVSPTGNAIVWEKCQTNGLDCDIYSAVRTAPGVFTTNAVTTAAGEDRSPQTNGEVVVYVSNRTGENEIYIKPLTGGSESHLSIPGDQRDLSISGNLISFESSPPFGPGSQYDIYVYDLSSAHLYRVTNTPVNETLNDIAVCNGVGRIVYAAPGMDFDVHSFTFQVPNSAEKQIEDLISLVESFGLLRGPENSLITKLENALAALEASDTATACDSLNAFISECQAQSGKKLTADQANQLINAATEIRTDLGCQ